MTALVTASPEPDVAHTEGIDDAPLIALAGGLAAGALIAALLPRTDAETRALRPVGKRIRGTARDAA